MGDLKDVAMEALLQAQNLAIQGLKDEIERLRAAVRAAYLEGHDDGRLTRRSWTAEHDWEVSVAKADLALDNAP